MCCKEKEAYREGLTFVYHQVIVWLYGSQKCSVIEKIAIGIKYFV